MSDVQRQIGALVAGTAAWAGRSPAERAALALRTARTVAAASNAWIEAAAAIKQSRQPSVDAEETATGPLATLRLLLLTARALADIGRTGLPQAARPPRLAHAGERTTARIEVDVLPALGPHGSLRDTTIFGGHTATVRCADPGGVDAFLRSWRAEADRRPQAGGVALVLGAGNVTGLAPADCVSQIFERGRTVFLKLHPLHATMRHVLNDALRPLVEAGLLVIVAGGAEVAKAALASPGLDHVHLTGGAAAFDALVWGGRRHEGTPALAQSITCELGNVTPWIIVPGRYTSAQLAAQADMVAASIANNTSFNCIATKLVVTARSWPQRDEFLGLIDRRLKTLPARPAWYPGSAAAWEAVAGVPPPREGTLPSLFRTSIDPDRDPQFVEREWFVPVAAEIPLAADSIEVFCGQLHDLVARLPGSLAASVTLPPGLAASDTARAELLIEHLPFGVVAVNTWSALAYSIGNVPWGGFPGGTLADPRSGIGFVHDPLFLPLVHNTILRGPLAPWPKPAWLPWHRNNAALARGLLAMYAEIARGRSGLWQLARMVPAVLAG
jgi:acyl-CoA reductase-like NAD-dependent aldehyde dehydrogenase